MILVLLVIGGGTVWFVNAIAPLKKREAAAEELRRMGFQVEPDAKFNWNEVWQTVNRSLKGPPQRGTPAWLERVMLVSNPAESLDLFAPALVEFRPSYLLIDSCPRLTDLNTIRLLRELDGVEIRACPLLRDLAALGELDHLQTLMLTGIAGLKSVPQLKSASSLSHLLLKNCNELSNFDGLGKYTELRILTLRSQHLKNADKLRPLSHLTHLVLSNCTELTDVTALHSLTKLQLVRLEGCVKLTPAAVAALRAALPGAFVGGP